MSLSFANTTRFLVPTATLLASLVTTGTAAAASLQGPISGWQQGTEPSNMSMYIYVPDGVADNAPILVALHYCGGMASNIFQAAQSGGVVGAADTNGFIILLPQTSRNCWDVGTTAAMTHDGGSDTKSIVHQVQYVVSEYGGNPDRVYAMGQSGGAMAVEGLLAVYPDVFKGGSEFSGVPAGCWGVGNMTDGQWSSQCANGQVTHTAQEWGDMVRAMYPDYSGTFRPRMQLWHGDADPTINFANQGEAEKQWTNVLGVSTAESSSVSVAGHNFNRKAYKDACGMVVLDVLTEPGGPHNTSVTMTSQQTISFLSLDVPGDTDPQAASECWTGEGGGTGGSGAGGGAGTGGGTGAGGTGTGVGGSSTGAGGTGTGVGGTTTGAGGGAVVGSGGTGGAGTVGGTGGAGTVGSGGTGVPTDGGVPPGSSGGCSVSPRNILRPDGALALAGLLALTFARRRHRRAARVS